MDYAPYYEAYCARFANESVATHEEVERALDLLGGMSDVLNEMRRLVGTPCNTNPNPPAERAIRSLDDLPYRQHTGELPPL